MVGGHNIGAASGIVALTFSVVGWGCDASESHIGVCAIFGESTGASSTS